MPEYQFKAVNAIPKANDLIDIALSKTQRKTPTEVHPQYKITRIRKFYMRKVKYAAETFHEKFTEILTSFPKLDEIHEFYDRLFNILYDKDHFKLALGHVNAIRSGVDTIAKDYVRLMKFSDSPYKCKMLKRAALGRMCTLVKKLGPPFEYLEEVRQHMGRLPTINPSSRTIVLAGYPNVGKSSFMNCVSKANVDVQPFPFTTKSVFVGHFDRDLMRWQVLDTPGVLDRPFETRNTIEMTAITAIAALRAAIIYFLDLSESCGFNLDEQTKLFHALSSAFENKPVVVLLNKTDLRKAEDLTEHEQGLIRGLASAHTNIAFMASSSLTKIGVEEARNKACDMLLQQRIAEKLETTKANSALAGLYVTKVDPPKSRPPTLPKNPVNPIMLKKISKLISRNLGDEDDRIVPVAETKEVDDEDNESMTNENEDDESLWLEKDLEEKFGGPGNYQFDDRKLYQLEKDEWKYDEIPEIFQGKNISDFVDPDIERKLAQLEAEEEQLLKEYEQDPFDDNEFVSANAALKSLTDAQRMRKTLSQIKIGSKRHIQHSKVLDPTVTAAKIRAMGFDSSGFEKVIKTRRSLATLFNTKAALQDLPENAAPLDKLRHQIQVKQVLRSGGEDGKLLRATISPKGLSNPLSLKKAMELDKRVKKSWKTSDHVNEADRFIGTKMPKHLFSGKRGLGTASHR